jgi:putative CocE/NonD family hydrolase
MAVLVLLGIGLPLATDVQATPGQAAGACGTAFPVYDRGAVSGSTVLLSDVPITMSDGAVLRADVALPSGLSGPFPVSLTITGYGKSGPIAGVFGGGGLTSRGYATVTLDDRGTGTSAGTWDSWSERTVADYTEVLDWIVTQPWSDGRIGLTGGSYMGITSLYAAASGHPAVKAVFATVPMADGYRDIVLGGGQVNTAFIPLWMGLVTALGVASGASPAVLADHLLGITQFQLPMLAGAATGGAPAYDGPFWRQRSPIEVVDDISVPTFIVGGLDDIFQRGEPLLYERLADHTDARLLLGPWTHAAAGSGLPRDGVPTPNALLLQWFDQHVLGLDAGAECIPPVTQYVRGRERYESAATWPVPGLSAQRWHLRGDGALTVDAPAAGEGSRQYLQLPVTGICTRSAAQWLIGLVDSLPCATDNRLDEAIGSLTYTSEPFTAETYINGPIQADVWVTSSTPDAVVSVAVSDVAPDGTSRGLTNGLLLASHRAVDPARSRILDGQSIQPWHPFTEVAKQAVTPGEPTLLPIEVFPTSAAIGPGHRLRITVAPYDVPHALPSLPGALDTLAGVVAVLSDAEHPSSVVLPVVDAVDAGSAVEAAALQTTSLDAGADGGAGAGATDASGATTAGSSARGEGRLATTRSRLPETGGAGVDLLLPVLALGTLVLRRRVSA